PTREPRWATSSRRPSRRRKATTAPADRSHVRRLSAQASMGTPSGPAGVSSPAFAGLWSLAVAALLVPKPRQHDQRTDQRRHDVPERHRDFVEVGQQAKQSEQQSTHQRAGQTDQQVAPKTETLAVALYDEPGQASAQQADNDPDDDLVDRGHWHAPDA